MLIEFSVANFRSFRERQTFQMTAAPRLSKKENTFSPKVPGEKLPALLKVAAIYGGNASGKSSLILALGMISALIKRGPDATNRVLPVSPFRFDKELLGKPSSFEVHFIADQTRYEFRLSATSERITEEVLISYPRGKETPLYSRQHVGDSDSYSFGNSFEGDEILRTAWRRLTGPQSLFIAQAVANSNEDLRQLRTPFAWLESSMFVLEDGLNSLPSIGRRIPSDKGFSAEICTFLQDIDVPVTNIVYEQEKSANEAADDESTKGKYETLFEGKGKTTLTHETRLGSAQFDFSEESSGTQNLVGLWLPWQLLTTSRESLKDRYRILVIDEFDSSLHPELVEYLVSKHLTSDTMTQLIFTTHDTHLMSTRLLRRDQFWLTDRNSDGATRLRSIHAVEGRESEDVEKRYYEGRYRGLPVRRGK